MRDIVPNPDSSSSPKPTPFKGSQVPVSKIHLYETRDVPWKSTTRQLPPVKPPENRPLFFNKTVQQARVGHRERTIVFGFFGLAIVIALAAAIIFLPSAHVRVIVKTSPLIIDKDIVISSQENASETTVPGTIFFREVERTAGTQVTSTETIGTKAQGEAQIVNKTAEEQKIKEGSRLVTKDNILFYMKKSAILPPNGAVTVPIEAAEAGPTGNIDPQRLNFAALDAAAQSVVYGQTLEKITSGTGDVVAIVKESDIEKAKQEAQEQVRSQVEADIRKQLPFGWTVLEESWTNTLTTFTPKAAIGDKVPTVEYTARVKVSVMGYEKEKFQSVLSKSVDGELNQDFMLFPGEISYSKSIGSIDWEKGEAVVKTKIEHMTIPRLSLDALKDKLAGRSQEEAEQYLKGLASVRTASVELSPFWVRSVPKISKRITIDLEADKK